MVDNKRWIVKSHPGAVKVTEMEKVYRCPKCGGIEVKWDYGLRKIVCPKDRTPLDESWEP